MTGPTRIRALARGDHALVRALLDHPMESGQRRDDAGRPIPARHIETVTVGLNGRTVLTAHWGTAVSRNPFVELVIGGARRGDRITIAWQDSAGVQRSDDSVVT